MAIRAAEVLVLVERSTIKSRLSLIALVCLGRIDFDCYKMLWTVSVFQPWYGSQFVNHTA